MALPGPLPREVETYYAKGSEVGRLFRGHGTIELARTQEIILRHLPPPPGAVLDVGGGSMKATRACRRCCFWAPSII